MSEEHHETTESTVRNGADGALHGRWVDVLDSDVDLRLVGIHVALTPIAAFACQQAGLGLWWGVFVVWSVYPFTWMRQEMTEPSRN
ncbi:hypothetical protein ACFPYI_14070 [Halomarina salina]|uniref:Uncharacterized protein n=1 Tax=Halomarina salina TaxID=1872699 RepID=A0ABD5RQ48_9EURY|nr:hypothetical protein [Halomarina salina]